MPLHLETGVQPIAGYTLIRLLGRGGFGEVWEASAPGDFRIALKFIQLDTREGGVEQRALDVIRNIRHPHLLDVQFAARVEDCLVVAMPLCDESLMDRLSACPHGLPRNELLGYMVDLSRAVDYLNEPRHKASDGALVGVQHRDLKPHNIFLVGGSVRLADFGLAKVLAASSASHTGSMSPNYVAPEAIEGRVSKQSDQYSLAVAYVQLRSGTLPFVGESVMQIIYAHIHTAPDLSGLPEHERPVVARALAKRPEERWPSCQAFVRALVGAARSEGGRLASESQSQSGSKRVPDARAEPPTRGFSKLPETQWPPPGHPTGIDDESSSRVAAVAMGLRHPWLWLFSLAVVLAGLAAVLLSIYGGPSTPLAENEPAVPVEPPKPITNTIGMKLVLIPSGEFQMGSPDTDKDAEDDEKPQHRVRITRPFYLGATEVTVGQFRRVVESVGFQTEAEKDGKGGYGWNEAKATFEQDPKYTWRNPGFAQTDEHPVVNVSWNDAIAFCNKLSEIEGLKPYYPIGAGAPSTGDGYRLPTEAEWEYACRAKTTTRYEGGDDPETLATVGNIADATTKAKFPDWTSAIAARDGYVYTAPVGRFRPNAFGLFDMHGNVWEWCLDGYKAEFYNESLAADPCGPRGASVRVIRGGGWVVSPRDARSAYRYGRTPDDRGSDLGFRLVRVQSGSR